MKPYEAPKARALEGVALGSTIPELDPGQARLAHAEVMLAWDPEHDRHTPHGRVNALLRKCAPATDGHSVEVPLRTTPPGTATAPKPRRARARG